MYKTFKVQNCSAVSKFTFVDLFAGIGGFHQALKDLGGQCIAACEIDEKARKTYLANHYIPDEAFFSDINKLDVKDIPNHDVLCAGFPCQPFSQAGNKMGFKDERGILFFRILSIIKEKRPKGIFLENVRHFKTHNNGDTFKTVKNAIEALGYNFFDFIVYAKNHGLPQHRPRLFMICLDKNKSFNPPKNRKLELNMSKILGGKCNKEIGYTIRVGGRKSPILDRHNWDGYIVDGKEHRLTVEQAVEMQGFPKDFIFPVSKNDAMKQLGNSVAIHAIRDYSQKILEALEIF